MAEALAKLIKLINGSIEFLSIAIMIATAIILSTDGWRKGRAFFFSAVITGTVFGYVSEQTTLLEPYSYIIAVVGTITGPATLAVFRHKTIADLMEMARKKKKGDEG